MLWKEIYDDQLFVFFNGELVFKKWLISGVSVVFNSYGAPSWGKA